MEGRKENQKKENIEYVMSMRYKYIGVIRIHKVN